MVDDFDVVLQNGGSAYRAWARLSMGCASMVAAMLPQQQPVAAASLDTSTVVRPLMYPPPKVSKYSIDIH